MSARQRSEPWFGQRRGPEMPPPMRLPAFRTEWRPIPDDERRRAAEAGYILPATWPVNVIVDEDAPRDDTYAPGVVWP